MKPEMERLINALSDMAGIVPFYYDIWGERHETSLETKGKILFSMGYDAENEEALREAVIKKRTPSFLEPVYVIRTEEKKNITFHLPYLGEAGFRVGLKDEAGGSEGFESSLRPEGQVERGGQTYGRYLFEIGHELAPGYYGLSAEVRYKGEKLSGTARLIITPGACYIPEDYDKTWGMVLALYSLRSGRNWGIGDLTDLENAAKWIGGLGGDFAGVLPLHALPLPGGISPYSPVSRLYSNFIYIDIEAVPEFQAIKGRTDWKRISALRNTEFVDYPGVYAVKEDALRGMFSHFYEEHYKKGSGRVREFEAWLGREGQSLLDYATFTALSEIYKTGWMDWPEGYKNPHGKAVEEFREKNPERVLLYAYAQWLFESQLEKADMAAGKSGMRLGLYFDLAIGSLGGGADAWGFRDQFAIGSDAGAPPDNFSLAGQNWGFPPLVPDRLRESGYELFIKTIRKNLEHGGMLRIDHALSLFRLFWIPEGSKPADGTYVNYPSEDLLGIVALESQRRKAVIVAEDLGTIPPEVRRALAGYRMLSYRLFYYERKYPAPDLVAPEDYPHSAFCAITTHDLPTICGFWEGRDIAEKKSLSLYPSEESYNKEIEARERDRRLIMETLKKEGLLPADYLKPERMDRELMLAIYGYLARTPALTVGVSLDDWLGVAGQQNMPGTAGGHPNWRRKSPQLVEEFTRGGQALSALFRRYQRGR